jgi:hypothetical protein
MKFLLIAFTSSSQKVLDQFCNLSHDRLWSQKEGCLVDWKGRQDRFYKSEFPNISEPLTTPSCDFGLDFAYYFNPQRRLIGT